MGSFVHEFCYVSSHSYAFRIATELGTDLNKYFDLIEDVVAQADEVDDKYLQVNQIWKYIVEVLVTIFLLMPVIMLVTLNNSHTV